MQTQDDVFAELHVILLVYNVQIKGGDMAAKGMT